jgi:hypothetical protein
MAMEGTATLDRASNISHSRGVARITLEALEPGIPGLAAITEYRTSTVQFWKTSSMPPESL